MVVPNNSCCPSQKDTVKIVAHLSMALAFAVGVMSFKLISISLEVAANPHFHQQHLSPSADVLEKGRNEGQLWKSDILMKADSSFPNLIYGEEEEESDPGLDELTRFSQGRQFSTSRDFHFEYSKVVLVCGLMALFAVSFQFLCSFLLLCFINWEGKAPSHLWVAVHCSILFCLATCLVVFLCGESAMPGYSLEENLFLILVTADVLLSGYFMWAVMSFI